VLSKLRRLPTWTKQSTRQYGGSSHRILDLNGLPLLSQHHSAAPPSLKRYDKRYEDRFLPQVERTPEIQSLRS
jgi:hypothetical protein